MNFFVILDSNKIPSAIIQILNEKIFNVHHDIYNKSAYSK